MHAEESGTMAVITAEASRVQKIRLNGHLQPRGEVTCGPEDGSRCRRETGLVMLAESFTAPRLGLYIRQHLLQGWGSIHSPKHVEEAIESTDGCLTFPGVSLSSEVKQDIVVQ